MKKTKKGINKLGLIGFLGLLALIWPITGQWPFIFTIGYFTFFKYLRVIPDELFKENMRRSAATGFFITQLMFAATFVSWAILSEVLELVDAFDILYWGNIISIGLGFMIFSLQLSRMDKKEKNDIKNFA